MTTAPVPDRRRTWIGSTILLLVVLGIGAGFFFWKRADLAEKAAAPAFEPSWTVTVAPAGTREYQRITTAIGTVIALQSITMHNELAGTVAKVTMVPGQVVEPGTVLVQLDVSVEEAELRAQKAQAELGRSMLERMQRASSKSAASEADVDRARSERDVALAQVARTEAIIARKTIRAPFRARVGMSDVHAGQYLRDGTQLTTLQGVDEAVHIDFTVTQVVAAGMKQGDKVEVVAGGATATATVAAIDARVDANTRNAWVRARLEQEHAPLPGASVRVRVPLGQPVEVIAVPVQALRKGPGGDHVFLVAPGPDGKPRAQERKVKAGPSLGDAVVILEGLQPGEQVAVTGSFKLYEGALVAVAGANAEANGNGRGQ